jgi:hypothetical protein
MKMLPKEYVDVRECQSRRDKNESNDCTVIAMSIALQMPYDEAHAMLERAGRKRGDGFAMRRFLRYTSVDGFKFTNVDCSKPNPDHSWMQAYSRTKSVVYPTLAQVQRDFPKGRFILTTCNHAIAMVDGKVLDFSGAKCRIRSLTYVERV